MKKLNWLVALFLIVSSPVIAADDVATAQSIIRSQLDAMDRDDAASAYSFASPDIRRMFQEADSFMTMVRRNYAAVYRHKSFEFGDSRAQGGIVVQEVKIVDANGVPWQAIYTLEQQPDGSVKDHRMFDHCDRHAGLKPPARHAPARLDGRLSLGSTTRGKTA